MISRPKTAIKPLAALTEAQGAYMSIISTYDMVSGMGPAGTGKTWCSVGMAADALIANEIERIYITRPAIEADEKLGFLPGELDEKFAPYFAPVRDVLVRRLGAGTLEHMIKAKKIVAQPLAYMRGWTFENCWVICDEAQNTTPRQMKMLLTRVGENCKMICEGDIEQADIDLKGGMSGLEHAVRTTRFLDSVRSFEFTDQDIVRSGLCSDIVQAYRRAA